MGLAPMFSRHSRFWKCATLGVVLFLALPNAAEPRPKLTGKGNQLAPDGVCYRTDGVGYIVSAYSGMRATIGPLSPFVEGDSLVVLSGTITTVDFRTGHSSTYGGGTRLLIPPVKKPKPPTWCELFQEHLMRCMSKPELQRIGGSVRGGDGPLFAPDTARFAPGVLARFEWQGVRPQPRALRIAGNRDTVSIPLGDTGRPSGIQAWRVVAPEAGSRFAWQLLDARGEPIGGGRFEVLSAKVAEAERARYLEAAAGEFSGADRELAAAVLAAEDRNFLW